MRNTRRTGGARGRGGGAVALIALAVAMVLGLTGWRPAAAQDDGAVQPRVVVLHADWSLGPVDVYLNNDEVLSEFAYGQVSDWIAFEPGNVRITITSNQGALNSNYIAFDAVYPAPAGNDYSLIVTTPIVLAGVFDTSPIPDDGARVRVVHGAVSLQAVDVSANDGNVALAQQLRYSSVSDYTVVPAGTYDFEVTLSRNDESVLAAPGMVLEANTTYELVLMGEPGDANHPLELRPLADTTQESPTATP
jgi:hypothetical protein